MDLSTELPTLDRAADDAVRDAVPPAAGELWARGDRWRRRRRRGTAVGLTLGAVLVAALAGLTLQRSVPPEPAVAPGSGPTLPDRVWEVSPWLDVAVPREPVVAAQGHERGTWAGNTHGIAVLTGSGRYVFLDAPEVSGQGDAVVSPDGRHVAYWATGRTGGTPNTGHGQASPVAGVAVLDVVSGEVTSHDFPTAHGLQPQALLWADAHTLLGAHFQWVVGDDGPDEQLGAGNDEAQWRWDLDATGGPDPLDLPAGEVDSFTEAAGDLLLVGRHLHDLRTGVDTRLSPRGGIGSTGASGSSAFLRTDGVLAQVGGSGLPDRFPNRVTMADLTSGDGAPRRVPGTAESAQVLGWRDDDHLVVVRRVDPTAPGIYLDTYVISSVNVTTGGNQVLVDGGGAILPWTWASDLLSAPVAVGVEPPDPLDPRLVAGAVACTVLLTLGGLGLWRRRARP